MRSWPEVPGLIYGGDYNPEQWPEDVWVEDVRLMREAGVNLVSVAIFSWALLEPAEGRYEFGWLDRILDLLADGGIAVDLATATASPPPWFSLAHPDSLPVTRDGRTLWPGSRQTYCPSSAAYRERATALAEQMALHYGDHRALRMWHVNNEYGCHVPQCYCDVSAEAFRVWLRERYGSIEALNDAWGTSFWSQRYSDWAEIAPSRRTPTWANPGQRLDFFRFSNEEMLDCYRAEREVLRRITPDIPVTTNFILSNFKDADYWTWAPEVDLVANDHYLRGEGPDVQVDLAFAADQTRSLAAGDPWLLMESSTSAVNWQARNLAKLPGQLPRNSLQHVARGADGVMFFQWRASRAGAEKFHSGMLPHAGTDTKVFREVSQLGADLRALQEVRGTRVDADVAIVWDWEAWWAIEMGAHPSTDVTYPDQARALYRALWDAGVTVDFVHPESDLSGYRLLLVPSLYLVSDRGAGAISAAVERGATVLVTYFSGIVDEHDAIRLGGYPGAFRDLLGVRVEEFFPLRKTEKVRLDDGSRGDVWTELLHLTTAEAVASYVDGPLPGVPAVTRAAAGGGTAWYVATRLAAGDLARLLERVCGEAGVRPVAQTRPGVEAVRRAGDGRSYLFVLNHHDEPVHVDADGHELLTDTPVRGSVQVPAGGCAVVREAPRAG
jgi:beta-galactosidase